MPVLKDMINKQLDYVAKATSNPVGSAIASTVATTHKTGRSVSRIEINRIENNKIEVAAIPTPQAPDPTQPTADIPDVAKELVTKPPILWGIDRVTDFWSLLFGSAADKTDVAAGYLPVDDTTVKNIVEWVSTGANEPNTGWQNEPTATVPGFEPTTINFPELPDLGDIGKYALLGLLIIGGLYLGGSYLKSR